MGRLESIYAKLPVWAQHVAVSAYGCYWYWYRFGPGSRALATEYRERDFWTREQWSHWQREHLAALLQRAMKHVPYYERAWTKSDQLAAREGRIAELPLLEKEPLRANYRDFLDQSRAGVATKICHTSGSTGTPIATVWTREEMRRAMAVREARSAGWAGVSFHRSRATFSGRMAEPDPESRGPYYRYNWPERQVYFSPFHLRPDTAAQYVRALERHQVEWLTGYAVSYYLLAKMIVEHSLPRPTRLKAVVTTSEKLTAEMRAVMQTAYGCRVYEEYSTVENVLFASECPAGKLHVSPDVGLVEILRSDGSPCKPGEPGEVVATCFMRTHQPLIRYRVGDVASWSAEPCDCGRAMPVIQEVCGRVEDVVIGPDGRQLVRFHGIFVDQPNVREGQIVQEALDRIRVKIVPTASFNQRDRDDIIARVQSRLGPQVHVEVESTEVIPRNKAGKFQAVVNLMPRTPSSVAPMESSVAS